MANTREIRRRIKSIKNTAQITKAMQMVAASKMRRAQQSALNGRPFFHLLAKMLQSLREKVDVTEHLLLHRHEEEIGRDLVIVISTDKGLCGGLNTNLFREISKLESDRTRFVSLGRKGAQFLTRTKRDLYAQFELHDSPTYLDAKRISQFALEQFREESVDRVFVAHSNFVNTLTQRAVVEQLVPIHPHRLEMWEKEEMSQDAAEADPNLFGYLFEPSPEQVLDDLLPFYVHYSFYSMLLDSRACEHSARMVAMKAATDNAKQLVKDLTLEYNKVRQAAITTELLEITTAQAAISG